MSSQRKNRKRRGLENLLKKIRKTGTTDRKKGSGRPRCACTEDNVSSVEELVLSQEEQLQTHRSICQRGTFRTNSVTTSVTRWTGNVSNCVKLKYEDILLYFVCNWCQFRIVVFHKVV